MVAKKSRLTRSDIERVKRAASMRKSTSYITVCSLENERGYNRFAVVVGNNVSKKSTERHAWKRYFMREVSQWPNTRRDFLIIVGPKIKSLARVDIRGEIHKVFEYPIQ